MKTYKGYHILDLILLLSGITTVVLSCVLFSSAWYVYVSTLLGLVYVFTQAKGKVITMFLGVVYFCFYIYVSCTQKYYGEALVYITSMMPLYIYGIIHWLRHRDKVDNVVLVRNNLSKKEWLISSGCFAVVSVGVYFLLRALNTSQLLISTLSFLTILPSVYLLVRRCKWNQVSFFINDLFAITLWLLLALQNSAFYPMFIYHIFQIAYDIYGLIVWIKLEQKQKDLIS